MKPNKQININLSSEQFIVLLTSLDNEVEKCRETLDICVSEDNKKFWSERLDAVRSIIEIIEKC